MSIQNGLDAGDQGGQVGRRSPACVHVAGDLVEVDAKPQQRDGKRRQHGAARQERQAGGSSENGGG